MKDSFPTKKAQHGRLQGWKQRTAEIDQQIIDFYQREVVPTGQAIEDLSLQILDWMEQQVLSAQESFQLRSVKSAESEQLRARIAQRVSALEAAGRILRQGDGQPGGQCY